VEALDRRVYDQLTALGRTLASGDLTNLDAVTDSLQSAVFTREYAFLEDTGLEDRLAVLNDQSKSLHSGLASAQQIYAPCAGLFSAQTDGLESLLAPGFLDALSPDAVAALGALRPLAVDADCPGKLIKGFTWYLVFTVGADERNFEPGDKIDVRFEQGVSRALTMTVCAREEDQSGRAAVAASCEDHLADIVALRTMPADIVTASYSGISVPREAVRVLEDGTPGVYCLVGLQAEFKQIDVVYDTGVNLLVRYDLEDEDALRPGDDIIVAARDLYDGKIVK